MTGIRVTAVVVTAIRNDLKHWMIINIGSTIILWWSVFQWVGGHRERDLLQGSNNIMKQCAQCSLVFKWAITNFARCADLVPLGPRSCRKQTYSTIDTLNQPQIGLMKSRFVITTKSKQIMHFLSFTKQNKKISLSCYCISFTKK